MGGKELQDSQSQLLRCGNDEREKKLFDDTTSGSEESSSVILYSFIVSI